MNKDELGYDPTNVTSIVEYAQRLVGHTLRDFVYVEELADTRRRRGSFGNAVEEYYFKYDLNSDSNPDFAEVGLELKTTPVKKNSRGELVSKERLVFTMIDYDGVVKEDFEHSQFLKKSRDILLITYLYEPDKNALDYIIEAAARWGLPEEDIPQIKKDWETVVEKVRSGHAEDISGGDTLYLEACTKAADSTVRRSQPFSDVLAKPRAWALKASYMTAVQRKIIDRMRQIPRSEGEGKLDLLGLLRMRFAPYFGLTERELAGRFSLSRSKDLCARITRRILGVGDDERIEEFEKAGIKPKTLRLQRSGRPKEAVSFPTFDYFKLAERSFEDSDFLGYLSQKYLFVIYREDEAGEYRLRDICFWQMPERDLEEARACYEQMQENVRQGRADISVRSSENRCCHVRPHGQTKKDTKPQPFGPPVVKKCFWLNQGYLQGEIERVLSGN